MTAVADLHPLPGHPAAVLAAVTTALAGAGPVTGLSGREIASAISETARVEARLAAYKLKLIAAAEKSTVVADAGAASPQAWLATTTRTTGQAAAAQVKLATALDDGLVVTSDALGEGALSAAHAAVIAQIMAALPNHLDQTQRDTIEAALVAKAARLAPDQLRREGRRILAEVETDPAVVDAHENQVLHDEETRAWAAARLTLHDNTDGTTSGHFTVPHLAGAVLKKVVDAMTSPRRGKLGATDAQAGDQRVSRDWAQARGVAFAQLLERLPTDHLPQKVAATILVTLDHSVLRDALKAAGLDTGEALTAGTARRLACQAGLIPAVLGGRSAVLDLGHSQRFFSDNQRTAGGLKHKTCVADGCQVPYAWTELHHLKPWSQGGRTDLKYLRPLCGFHHHRIHDPTYHHEHLPDGTIRFTRRT